MRKENRKRKRKKKKLVIPDIFLYKQIKPRLSTASLTVSYLIITGIYLFIGDKFISIFFNDRNNIEFIMNIKQWVFIIINTTLLFIFTLFTFTKSKDWIDKFMEDYERLKNSNNDLIVLNENLTKKYKELQKNDEVVRQNNGRYELAVDAVNYVVWEWDLITDEFIMSDKWCDITGYNINKFYKFNEVLKVLVFADDLKSVQIDLNAHLAGKKQYFESQFRIKTKGKQYKWVLIKGKMIIDKDKQPVKILGLLSDATFLRENGDKL